MNALLSISDINTTINHEPRILDLRLAEALGFEQPRMIRKLITRHFPALDKLGTRYTVERVIRGGKAVEYYLTKKQAAYLATKSETDNALEVTIHIIEVFDAATRGEAIPVQEKPACTLRDPITPEQQFRIRQAIAARVEWIMQNWQHPAVHLTRGLIYRDFYRALKGKFHVAKYDQIEQRYFNAAMQTVEQHRFNPMLKREEPALLPGVDVPALDGSQRFHLTRALETLILGVCDLDNLHALKDTILDTIEDEEGLLVAKRRPRLIGRAA